MGLAREIATVDAALASDNLRRLLIFEKDFDDLDSFTAAIFEIDGVAFALQLYDNCPTGDFTLIVSDDAADDEERLQLFLKFTGLPKSAIRWLRPTNQI